MFEFIETHLKDPELIELFNEYPINDRKADFFRFFALYTIGGIYDDTDCEPFVPISKWPLYPFNTT